MIKIVHSGKFYAAVKNQFKGEWMHSGHEFWTCQSCLPRPIAVGQRQGKAFGRRKQLTS